MLIPILVGLALLIVLLVVMVACRPADFRVARSLTMTAPAEVIFEQVQQLRAWEAWNPWGKLDPHAQLTYAGPPAGVGASYTWAGNAKVGAGRSTIVETQPGKLVRLRLEFFQPMKAVNAAEFTFQPQGAQTNVTWTMTGKNNFIGKAFGLIVNCDQMIGSQFEKGLAAMKTLVEANAR